jgi:cytochrome c biogenesis protein CcmG/thiol:disulfide interchange protein DsbE
MLRFLYFLITAAAAASAAWALLPDSNTADTVGPISCKLVSIQDRSTTMELKALRGKRYVLEVFAPWCGYCAKFHSTLMSLKGEVPIYGIAWRSEVDMTKKWLELHGNPYNLVGEDMRGSCLAALGISGVPAVFVIDEEGKVIFRGQSNTTREQVLEFFNGGQYDSQNS